MSNVDLSFRIYVSSFLLVQQFTFPLMTFTFYLSSLAKIHPHVHTPIQTQTHARHTDATHTDTDMHTQTRTEIQT